MNRLYKSAQAGPSASRPSTTSYNTRKSRKQSAAESAGSGHAARLGLPPRPSTTARTVSRPGSVAWPSGPAPPPRNATPDARDPAELAALLGSRRRAPRPVPVHVPTPDDSEPEVSPVEEVVYDNPKQNPFNFIEAVQDGSADFLEFVYLNPRKSDDGDSNPYNLEIVPVSEINRTDYYTLGISGVTHFREGSAEFSPVCLHAHSLVH